MADYLLMVLEDETAHAAQSPRAIAELIERRARFSDGLRRAGQLRDSGRFRPSKEGKRVRRAGDRLEIEGGPFAGKALGQFYWVQAHSVDEAAQLATACPALPSDEVDVRPLMKGQVETDKEGKPGKIFGFAVLGTAGTEEGWVKVMDRIDADTANLSGSFLGGVRLHRPTSGRRIAARGERHAVLDGPFYESKEVIGGVFFLRMAHLHEAVQWAGETPFVVHGALEIREVWRS